METLGRRPREWQALLAISVVLWRLLAWVELEPSAWGAETVTSPPADEPTALEARGRDALQRGAFDEAAIFWRDAAEHRRAAGGPRAQAEALRQLAIAYRALGHHRDALATLEFALELNGKEGEPVADPGQRAAILGGLADVSITMGRLEAASRYLVEAVDVAGRTGSAGDTASLGALHNDLGNLRLAESKPAEALSEYRESARLARKSGRPSLTSLALTNAARAALRDDQANQAHALLDETFAETEGLPPSFEKAEGLITIGLLYLDLDARAAQPAVFGQAKHTGQNRQKTLRAFEAASAIGEPAAGRRVISYARGHLGSLYEQQGRLEDALRLTREAVFLAQQVRAPESLYRWEWQTGRLFRALGDHQGAIAAYTRAVDTLQSIRPEVRAVSLGAGVASGASSSFRETLGPLYFGLVDLLLERARSLSEGPAQRSDLEAARRTVELFKLDELRDYFRDDCVDAARSRGRSLDEVVSSTTVAVYPILLTDRTELLVTLPGGSLRSYSVPVGETAVRAEARELREKLVKRATQQYLPHAQQLYDWLVRPYQQELSQRGVTTLVFVPDGPLRTIPMAALHDGSDFLVRRYAIATTPGLDLTDPRPLKREGLRVMAGGLSEAVQGFPPLPHVEPELDSIHGLYPGEELLNQQFAVGRLAQGLREVPFSVVHLASHGQFASDVRGSFILTFDDRLTMDRLSEMIASYRYRKDPLELLTLSACETAAGDDRAALGLAGIAVKAGARSALATLWRVSDAATAELIAEFYKHLADPATSRAAALQRAQLKLLDGPYRHPIYWSPFLLINNWL